MKKNQKRFSFFEKIKINHIEKTKLLETFQDGDVQGFLNKLQNSSEKQITKIILLKNEEQKTPLHLACQYGYKDIALKLIEIHNQFGISLDLLDHMNQTPLYLLCSQGYYYFNFDLLNQKKNNNSYQILSQYTDILNDRFIILQSLLNDNNKIKADIKNSIIKQRNNPLHWAIFYGDQKSGEFLFKQFPLMIMKQNEKNQTPFEFLVMNKTQSALQFKSKLMVKFMLEKFIYELFDDSSEFDILKNASQNQIDFYTKIKNDKKSKDKLNLKNQIKKEFFNEFLNEKKNENTIQNLDVQDQENKEFAIEGYDQEPIQKSNLQNLLKNISKLNVTNFGKKQIQIYKEQNSPFKEKIDFLHKLLIVAVFLKNLNAIQILMEQFYTSPFYRVIHKKNAFTLACQIGSTKIVKFFLDFEYIYRDQQKPDLKELLNLENGKQLNTCLHYAAKACKNKDINLFNILLEQGANPFKNNFLDQTPFDLNRDINFKINKKDIMDKNEKKNILKIFKNISSLNTFDKKAIQLVNLPYNIFIITNDFEKDYKKTLVYEQIEMIKNHYNDLEQALFKGQNEITHENSNCIEIKWMKPVKFKNNQMYKHYFLVYFSDEFLSQLAGYLGYNLYNFVKQYNTIYDHKNSQDFIRFRDFHKHQLIEFVLQREIDLKSLQKKGIIEDCFPTHQYQTRNFIFQNWQENKNMIYFTPLKFYLKQKDLRPYNSVAFYYGCDLALYISFTVFWTSYLIILGIFGLINFIINIIYDKVFMDFYLTPFYSFFIVIWVTILQKKWIQRKYAHVYMWNTETQKSNEIQQKKFKGFKIINDVNNKIQDKNPLSTKHRKLIIDIPLLIFGITLVVVTFVFTILAQNRVQEMKSENINFVITVSQAQVYLALIGILNGILIFIFTEIYKFICKIAVDWENHRFITTEENSFILKTFVFNFFISYINLFYYAFILQDFEVLALNFLTIIASKNVLFIFKTNVVPYIVYKFKYKRFISTWKQKRSNLKKFYQKEIKAQLYLPDLYQQQEISQKDQEKIQYIFNDKKFVCIFEYEGKNIDCNDTMSQTLKNKLWKVQNLLEQKLNLDTKENLEQQYFQLEKEMINYDQIQITALMPNPPDQFELWMNNAIQFGYICFFSISFPLITIYGIIMNILHIYLTFYGMNSLFKRKSSKGESGIGIWKNILEFISFFSIIVNIGILLLTSKQTEIILQKIYGQNYSSFQKAIFLIIVEHIIFFFALLIRKFIKDKPKFLKKLIKKREFFKNRDISLHRIQNINFIKMDSLCARTKDQLKQKFFQVQQLSKSRSNILKNQSKNIKRSNSLQNLIEKKPQKQQTIRSKDDLDIHEEDIKIN